MSAFPDVHDGLVITSFKESFGVYEHRKAQAFAAHCRRLADLAARAQSVRPCPKAPERPWVGLQEWTELSGLRAGQWQSDIEVERLR